MYLHEAIKFAKETGRGVSHPTWSGFRYYDQMSVGLWNATEITSNKYEPELIVKEVTAQIIHDFYLDFEPSEKYEPCIEEFKNELIKHLGL